ncbi:hypothetical protein MUO79_03890 [Candidatus Bathyarchaeota archaeon]|jgi:hypothetical protein|nr:hypothetical protein [Candidatus Bathyarchaeota archaeon]
MSKKTVDEEKLNVHLKGEVADKFLRIKQFLGLGSDTEVIRAMITWYYNQHHEELVGPPKSMWHMNLNDAGVLIWDPDIRQAVQILFSPNGIKCVVDGEDSCKHILFALTKPDIQQVIRARKKEGWKLPDV